jgi:hypothetical protein
MTQQVQVTKSLNTELKQATFVVLVPEEVDLHGDIVSEEEVRKACFNFNKHCMQANLMHMLHTDAFEFAESYVAPVEFMLDDRLITKGTWLATVQVHDDDVWGLIKSGEINGLSIGAIANVEALDTPEE